jgi:hypothetical protein
MKLASCLASGIALLVASVPAQSQPKENEQVKVQVGSALVCDTQQQVERFVALYDGDVQTTLTAVNDEQPTTKGKRAAKHACDVATIAYVLGPEVSQARSNGSGTFRVVRVLVLGVLTEQGLQASVPKPFYSAAKVDDVEA